MMTRLNQEQIRKRLKDTQKYISDSFREAVEKSALGKSMEKQVGNLQKGIENTVRLILQSFDVPTRKEITDLEKKVDSLAAKVEKPASEGAKKSASSKRASSKKGTSTGGSSGRRSGSDKKN